MTHTHTHARTRAHTHTHTHTDPHLLHLRGIHSHEEAQLAVAVHDPAVHHLQHLQLLGSLSEGLSTLQLLLHTDRVGERLVLGNGPQVLPALGQVFVEALQHG